MSLVKHEQITINNYSYLFGDQKKTSKIELSPNNFFYYTPVSLGGYGFKYIKDEDKIEFGCQSPKIGDIENVLRDLKGLKKMPINWYCNSETKKPIVEVDNVFEETSTFYIDKNGKTYKKSSKNIVLPITDTKRYIIQERDYGTWNNVLKWRWGKHFIGISKEDIIAKLEYVLRVIEIIKSMENNQ